ncbi:hypothetical protein FDP41_008897 [Naegleria fowleri]|uniref:Uncharacterized protein n=1 Tax=Naegleria fowleri TaxID=5763 RepID=A0A6A5BFB0_NAEFO|nr:uncharacterized protein FDP41_008897 [Naegleria fowleri]KAF0972648.1 hypothetical protein FDP41_008897 [Naegleria fowleri]CAG4710134.1 unnamed protein product [Naegleria fowleri]
MISSSSKVQQQHHTSYRTKKQVKRLSLSKFNQRIVKIMIVGNGSTGKTCLFTRLSQQRFPGGVDEYIPVTVDPCTQTVNLTKHVPSELSFTVELIDTASGEYYHTIREHTYAQVDLILVAYSCVDSNSLENVTYSWIPEARNHAPQTPIILVANKIDLRNNQEVVSRKQPIPFEEGEKVAKKNGCISFLETSALSDEGCSDFLEICVKAVMLSKNEESSSCCLQ